MLLRRSVSPRAHAESTPGGGWEESGRGRSGGVRVERSPAPQSGPGFACHPLARSAAENSIITAGESGDWERKIRDPATLGSACAPAALHPKHTHIFPPDLESHPKPPQVQVRDSALPPPRPPHVPRLCGPPGASSRLAPCPGAAPYPRGCRLQQGAGKRANERASQPASGGCHPTPAVRKAGGTEGWHPGAGHRVARRGQGNARLADPGEGRAVAPGGHLLKLRGRRGRGEEGEVLDASAGLCKWGGGAPRAVGSRGGRCSPIPGNNSFSYAPSPSCAAGGVCAVQGREGG